MQWTYPNSKILRVVDGDTFDVMLDLGCSIFTKQRVRLAHIDAYESYGKNKTALGAEAKKYCIKLMEGEKFEILSLSRQGKKGKYGRLIVDIKLHSGQLLSDHLVSKGFAIYKEY